MVIDYPADKAERERLIAGLFVKGFETWVAMQSEPSFAPFGELVQNGENDLDFTIQTSQGQRLMELAEFAPLHAHGPNFAAAPLAIAPHAKAALALELVQAKSGHQGGAERFLVLYATEHGFWLDPITIECLRRSLVVAPPHFERVYYVSPHDLQSASVSEIWPGSPHHTFGEMSDDQLANVRATLPHPREFKSVRELSGEGRMHYQGKEVKVRTTLRYINAWPIIPRIG